MFISGSIRMLVIVCTFGDPVQLCFILRRHQASRLFRRRRICRILVIHPLGFSVRLPAKDLPSRSSGGDMLISGSVRMHVFICPFGNSIQLCLVFFGHLAVNATGRFGDRVRGNPYPGCAIITVYGIRIVDADRPALVRFRIGCCDIIEGINRFLPVNLRFEGGQFIVHFTFCILIRPGLFLRIAHEAVSIIFRNHRCRMVRRVLIVIRPFSDSVQFRFVFFCHQAIGRRSCLAVSGILVVHPLRLSICLPAKDFSGSPAGGDMFISRGIRMCVSGSLRHLLPLRAVPLIGLFSLFNEYNQTIRDCMYGDKFIPVLQGVYLAPRVQKCFRLELKSTRYRDTFFIRKTHILVPRFPVFSELFNN